MRLIVWIYSLKIMILIPVSIMAQGRSLSRSEIDSIVNPFLLGGEEALRFDATVINIGKISEDDAPNTFRFRFHNVSRKTLILTRVSTSCGCTAASFSKDVIQPGGEGIVKLTFNPFEQAGILNKTAFVYTNLSEKYPTAKITLTGEVTPTSNKWVTYPYVVGNVLRLRQPIVWFRDLPDTVTRIERLVCINTGKSPLRLSALMIPRYAKFRTEPEVIPPGEEADIVVTVNSNLFPPTVKKEFTFPIVLEGLNSKPTERTIQVKISLQK